MDNNINLAFFEDGLVTVNSNEATPGQDHPYEMLTEWENKGADTITLILTGTMPYRTLHFKRVKDS